MKKLYLKLMSDSLCKNSIFLMLSTGVMAVFGFVFWIINARLYSPEQVGLATTLISVMTLISNFSLLGLGNGLIRYLPTSNRKNQKINTVITLVALTSFNFSVIYLVGINFFSPSLAFIQRNALFAGLFISFIVFTAIAALIDNIFIAYRSTVYVLIKNTLFSITKIILPLFLISLGAFGIFTSIGVAIIVSVLLSIVFLVYRFNYKIIPTVDKIVIKRIFRFSLGSYIAGFIGSLPQMILPILITNSLGPKFSAYFYMDTMIANLLYIIPMSVSQSLFAEGSYSETQLRALFQKAIRITALILTPAIIIVFFFGNHILMAFGTAYSDEGALLLKLLSLSAIFISINYIGASLLNIKHKIRSLILINIVGAVTLLILSIVLMKQSLLGIGIAWITAQTIASLLILMLIKKYF
jgi:O-antigen/teichoic acid export membrane protein